MVVALLLLLADAARGGPNLRGGPAEPEENREEAGSTRAQYLSEKYSVDLCAIQNATSRIRLGELPPAAASSAPPKVAFLFLLTDDLDQPAVWDAFFRGAPREHFSIYTHRARAMHEGERQSSAGRRMSGLDRPASLWGEEWGALTVPTVESEWCAITGVEVALLVEALRDPANQQFVFVSQDAVPLKSFSVAYQELTTNSATSKACFAEPAESQNPQLEFTKAEITGTCTFRDFFRAMSPRIAKHHQWLVLSRSHATAVVRNAEPALNEFRTVWERAAPNMVSSDGCSDEAVPLIAVLLEAGMQENDSRDVDEVLSDAGVEQKCYTFVRWRNCFSKTRFDLRKGVIRDLGTIIRQGLVNELMHPHPGTNVRLREGGLNGFPHTFGAKWGHIDFHYLRDLVGEGFLFGRKFPPGALVKIGDADGKEDIVLPLEAVLPVLWADGHSTRIWSRLEHSGMPNDLRPPQAKPVL